MERLDDAYGRSLSERVPDRRLSLPGPAVLAPTVAITASELLLFFGHSRYAVWSHFVTLLVCVFAPLRLDDASMFQAFALVPAFRLVNLGMPTFVELTIFWFPLVYAPLFPGVYVVVKNRSVETPRLRPKIAAALLAPALVVGAVLGEVEYAIIRPEPLIPTWSALYLAVIVVVMFAFVGLVEELVFRGVLQRALQGRLGAVPGLVLASFLFGMMHSAYGSAAEIAFAAGIGLLFGLVYDRTDSLLLIAILHGTLNVFLFAVIPFQRSIFGVA